MALSPENAGQLLKIEYKSPQLSSIQSIDVLRSNTPLEEHRCEEVKGGYLALADY